MIRLFVLCFFLVSCYSVRNNFVYDKIPDDGKWSDSINDDFDRYLQYFVEIDSTKDGYYLVYDLALDAVVPDAFIFFYDLGNSMTVCPFHLDSSYCRKINLEKADFPAESMEKATSLRPKVSGMVIKRIFGYKKKNGEKKYYDIYQMEFCQDDLVCKEEWKKAVQENIEQYRLNTLIFDKFENLKSLWR